ncbi:MAG TPA: MFS transporter, partial [Alphaproteobacteria bacterium]|nr:MFS transporter [Alphaproteobacteria bacterium]
YTLAAAGVVVALFSPVLGAIADVSGPRKPWIAAFGVLFVVSCSYLYTAVPGAPGSALWIAIALG